MTDLTQLVNCTMTKACSIKADKDSTVSKTINIKMTFKDIPLNDVVYTAMSPKVIQWQNGPGRKHWNRWTNNQTVEVTFRSPSKVVIDPMQGMAAKLATMTPEERDAEIDKLRALIPATE